MTRRSRRCTWGWTGKGEPVLLQVEDLHAYYGESHVLQGINLEVRAGEVVALLGRNGVGKTTTIHAICGALPRRHGRILFKGTDIVAFRADRIARLGLGLVPQGRGIFPDLTVRENLLLAARPRHGPWSEQRIYELFPRLKERLSHRGNELSGGEQQMLALSRALLLNPDLLLMDEPSEGLAPRLLREISDVLKELKALGQSILLVEQNLPLALSVADRVYVVNKGRIVYHGTPAELIADEQIKQTYLGV